MITLFSMSYSCTEAAIPEKELTVLEFKYKAHHFNAKALKIFFIFVHYFSPLLLQMFQKSTESIRVFYF